MKTAIINKGVVYIDPCPLIKTFLRNNGWSFKGVVEGSWVLSETQSRSSEQAIRALYCELLDLGYEVALPKDLEKISEVAVIEERHPNWLVAHEKDLCLVLGEDPLTFQAAKEFGCWDQDLKKRIVPIGKCLDLLLFCESFDFEVSDQARDLILDFLKDLYIPSEIQRLLNGFFFLK